MVTTNPISRAWIEAFTPRPRLTVSEWADRNARLPAKGSAEPGRFRTDRCPYTREIADCLSITSPVQEVVVMKGVQLGLTTLGNNWIGYTIDHAPAPILAVSPSVEMAKRNSRQRLAPMIEACPALREKVKDSRSRDSGNTMLSKEFPNGILVATGANTARGMRSLTARDIMLDEVDDYPDDVDGEGDPVTLAKARSTTYGARSKLLAVSTPTVKGHSKIEEMYDDSDRSQYHVPCPECAHFQVLKWPQVKWEDGDPSTAKYACVECGSLIPEWKKTGMLARGKWIARNPERKVRGFHISSLYSPVGWKSWESIVADFLKAKGKPDKLKAWVNTCLGETYEERGEAPKWQKLYRRREEYKIGTVPAGALVLTAGADIQRDRIEVEVVGWGRDRESWSIDYRVFPGEVAEGEVWKELEAMLEETFPHESGSQLPLRILAVDSGDQTQVVYHWARRFPIDRVLAVKGQDHIQTIVAQPRIVDLKWDGKRYPRGARFWPVGSALAKSELYGWLRLEGPLEKGDPYPAGFCHFPQHPDEWFKQLCAENRVPIRNKRGYRTWEWRSTRDRNEALDCRVYARAAASVLGIDRWKPQDWDKIESGLGQEPKARAAKPKRRKKPNPYSRGGSFGGRGRS